MVAAWSTSSVEEEEQEVHPLEGQTPAVAETTVAEPPVEAPVETPPEPSTEAPVETPAPTPSPAPSLQPAELQELEVLRHEAAAQAQRNTQLEQDKAVEDSIGLVAKKYQDAGWDESFVTALTGELRGVQTRAVQERTQFVQRLESESNKQQWATHFAEKYSVPIADLAGTSNEREMETRAKALQETNQLKKDIADLKQGKVPEQDYAGGSPSGGAMNAGQILAALGNGQLESDSLSAQHKKVLQEAGYL